MNQAGLADTPGFLARSQRDALAQVDTFARQQAQEARAQAVAAFARAGREERSYDQTLALIQTHARVVVHFHPDRCGRDDVLVAQRLLEEGIYRNQFETGISNGSLTAFSGGARDLWEHTLFGRAYGGSDVLPFERPKYGALELVRFPDGAIPRFGSCYFVLSERVKARTSFTFMGSEHPSAAASLSDIRHLDPVLAALLAEVEAGGIATPAWPPFQAPTLGVPNLTVDRVVALAEELPTGSRSATPGRVLDTVVEAQVHGPLSMKFDVDELICDGSFLGTETGELLQRAASIYGISFSWHNGFKLPLTRVPADFRGPGMIALAERVAGSSDHLTAAALGKAWRSLMMSPGTWSDWGSQPEAARRLQQLWHTIVHFGSF